MVDENERVAFESIIIPDIELLGPKIGQNATAVFISAIEIEKIRTALRL